MNIPTVTDLCANLFSAKYLPTNIRPEFLENVIQCGGFHLRSPVSRRLIQAALLRRIVRVGQGRFQTISRHLRPVKGRPSGIFLSYEGLGDRVTRSSKESAVLHGVIARVFVGDRGHNSLGEKSSGDDL